MFASSDPQRIDRRWRRSFRLNTVAFFSSSLEKTDKRLQVPLREGGVKVCFKLVVNVASSGVWQFVYDTNRPAFLERDLVGLCVSGNCQVWVRYCGGETVTIHRVRKGTHGFLQCKKYYIQYTEVGRLGS